MPSIVCFILGVTATRKMQGKIAWKFYQSLKQIKK